jgi:hypothetical protein
MHSGKDAFVDRFVAAEMKELKRGLQKYASDVWQMDLFVFLRAIQTKRGPHTYVQCIPTKRGLGKKPLAAVSQWNSDLALGAMTNDENYACGYFYAEVPISSEDNNWFCARRKQKKTEGELFCLHNLVV